MSNPRKLVPDHPRIWRVRWPDGCLSDMTNLTRAKDAVACLMETEQRRQRGRQSPLEGHLWVKTCGVPLRRTLSAKGVAR